MIEPGQFIGTVDLIRWKDAIPDIEHPKYIVSARILSKDGRPFRYAAEISGRNGPSIAACSVIRATTGGSGDRLSSCQPLGNRCADSVALIFCVFDICFGYQNGVHSGGREGVSLARPTDT